MTDPASRYCGLARIAIQAARSEAELKQWWRSETVRRHRYGLSQEQVAELAQACGLRVQRLASMQMENP